jgi:hypothetical protein
VVGEKRKSQILVNLHFINVPICTGSNAKTLELKHLQLPDMAAIGGRGDGARLVHHWTHELLIQQISVPNGGHSCLGEDSALPVSGQPSF